MIAIRKNPSFPQWMQILVAGCLFEEVEGRAKALRVAKKLAKQRGETQILFNDFIIDAQD